jgi:hypothetical protein
MLGQSVLQRGADGVHAEHGRLVVQSRVESALDQAPFVMPLRGVQIRGDLRRQRSRRQNSRPAASARTSMSASSGRPQMTAARSLGSPAITIRRQPRSRAVRRRPSATASIR